MGLEIAEMMMDLEDHFDVTLEEPAGEPDGTIGFLVAEIARATDESHPGKHTPDHIRGFLFGYLKGSGLVKRRMALGDETHLVKDLGLG